MCCLKLKEKLRGWYMAKAKEKLWSECSKEEKAEVKQIELDIWQLKEDYVKKTFEQKAVRAEKKKTDGENK